MTKILLDTVCLLGLAKARGTPAEEFLTLDRWMMEKDLRPPLEPFEAGHKQHSTKVIPTVSEACTAVVVDTKGEGEDDGSQPGSVSEADAMEILLVFQNVMTLVYRYVCPCSKCTAPRVNICPFISSYVYIATTTAELTFPYHLCTTPPPLQFC